MNNLIKNDVSSNLSLGNVPMPSQGAVDQAFVIGTSAFAGSVVIVVGGAVIYFLSKKNNVEVQYKDLKVKTTHKDN